MADLVIGNVLSQGRAALHEHETRPPEPPVWDEGFRAHGRARARWHEGARPVIADCRKVLGNPRVYAAHLADHPGAEADLRRLSRELAAALAAEAPETAHSRTRQRERRITRGRGALSM